MRWRNIRSVHYPDLVSVATVDSVTIDPVESLRILFVTRVVVVSVNVVFVKTSVNNPGVDGGGGNSASKVSCGFKTECFSILTTTGGLEKRVCVVVSFCCRLAPKHEESREWDY